MHQYTINVLQNLSLPMLHQLLNISIITLRIPVVVQVLMYYLKCHKCLLLKALKKARICQILESLPKLSA